MPIFTRLVRPGSYLWLVHHDIRMGWRGFTDMFARMSPFVACVVAGISLGLVHLLAWPAVNWLKPILVAPASDGYIIVAIGCILAWIIAQGLLGTTRLLFNRGDLDLLLGSPLPAKRMFAARVTALAAGSFGSVAVLTLPVANTGALMDGPVWLSAYPTLAALSLIGTAVGLVIGMALFYAVGPRHARVIAQLAAAVIAGSFVLSVQIVALLPKPSRDAILQVFNPNGDGERPFLLDIAVGAVHGDLAAIAGLLGGAIAVFAIVAAGFGRWFERASMRAAGAPSDGQPFRGRERSEVRFASGLGRSLRRKEWRLMLRDPNLFAQLALQMIYTVPVAVVMLRSDANIPTALAVAPTLIVIATQIAASLAWITVSGEDAPELIASAPVHRAVVDRGKLAAIAMPVLVILAVPLAGLAWLSLWSAVLTLACAVGGCTSAALLNLWHPMPGKRRGMLRRHSQSKVMGLFEHFLALLWAVVMVLALLGTVLVVVPLAIAVVVVLAWHPGFKIQRPVARHSLAGNSSLSAHSA